MADAMEQVQHQLQQFRGAPGQGAIVKQALQTFYTEIMALKKAPPPAICTCSCTPDLGAQVVAIELVMAGPASDDPVALALPEAPDAPDQCPPLAIATILAPVLAPAVVAIVSELRPERGSAPQGESLSSEKDPGADAEVTGHYSVETSPPNESPVLPLHSTEEGSSEDIEGILALAESNQLDRFMSLAQAQKATSEKVRRAAAARNRRAAAKKATIP